MRVASDGPCWDTLFETASGQEGHFTTAQAAEAGYSPQLLARHLEAGRIRRVRRSIYRLVHYPAGEHEDLVVLWLWSHRTGVFSHETALFLHDLSDALPVIVHMTLPRSWRRRRLRIPRGLEIRHSDVPQDDRAWVGSVPVTAPARTLRDCAEEGASPDLVRQARDEGLHRGIFARSAVAVVDDYLERTVFPLPKFVPEMELKSVEESPSPNQRRESRKGVRDVGPGVRRIAERTEGGEALRC